MSKYEIFKSFIKNSLFVLVVSILSLGNINKVSADEYDFTKTIELGGTYDINEDEWFDNFTGLRYEVRKGGIISVNNNLVATGIKPGIEYLTLYYEDESGTYQEVHKIIVKASDGVYRIKNSNTNKYLELSNSIIKGDVPLVCSSYNNNNEQLWVIKNNSDGTAKIRPYCDDNALLIYRADSGTIMATESKKDYISIYEDDSSMKCEVSLDGIALMFNSARLSYNEANGVYVGISFPDYLWDLEPVKGMNGGIEICDTYNNVTGSVEKRYIPINSTRSLNDLKIQVQEFSYPSSNSTLQWSSSNTAVATVDLLTGKVSGITPGVTTISCTKTINGVQYNESYVLEVVGIEDGLYSLSGYGNSFTISQSQEYDLDFRIKINRNGTSDFGKNKMSVFLKLDIDGYHQIISASVTNKNAIANGKYAFGLPNGNISTCVTLLNPYDDNEDYMKWKIEKNNDYNAYYISPKVSETGNDVLYMGAGNFINSYTFDDEDDGFYWNISPIENGELVINVHPIYDQTYQDIFGSKAAMEEFLDDRMEEISEIFSNEFDARIQCSEYVSYELIDDEAEPEVYNDWVAYYNETNGTEYKTDDALFNMQNVVVLFTNDPSKAGYGTYDKWVCINSYVDINDANSISHYAFGLLHEMGHAVGSFHHYHEGITCGNSEYCSRCADYGKRRDIGCVMNYSDYNTAEPFCSDCKKDILIHLYTHHVQYQNILN